MSRPLYVLLALVSVIFLLATAENAGINARIKRGFRGFHEVKSNKRTNYHRQVISHRTTTNDKGDVNVDSNQWREGKNTTDEHHGFTRFFSDSNPGIESWYDDNTFENPQEIAIPRMV